VVDAQRLGFAEADPSADVEGLDAAAKSAILARLAFGVWLDPEAIPRGSSAGEDAAPGITGVTPQAILAAGDRGFVIKLVGRAEQSADGTVSAWVAPVAVARSSPMGSTDGVTNIIEIEADRVGRLWFRGPGAGGPATSSAVLADLLALARGEGATWGALPEAPPAAVSAKGWSGPWLDLKVDPGRSRFPLLAGPPA